MNKFAPTFFHRSVHDIDLNKLKSLGVTTLFIDIDNTLATSRDIVPSRDILPFIEKVRAFGFDVYLISNNNSERVNAFNNPLGFEVIHRALKPLKVKVRALMRKRGIDKRNVCMIGDQVLTDIFCANRLGLYSVLVDPLSKKIGRFSRWRYRLGEHLAKRN